MARIQPSRCFAKEIFDGFGGISPHEEVGSHALASLKNYRPLCDGTLEKRCGYQSVATFPQSVRGVWTGTVGGKDFSFAVSGQTVFDWRDDEPVAHTVLESTSGSVTFCVYSDRLYLLDGQRIYILNKAGTNFYEAVGYVPLYGFQWDPMHGGEFFEPLNLYSTHLRVHYSNPNGSLHFRIPFYADTIDSVRIPGSEVDDFIYDRETKTVTLPVTNQSVEIAFTVSHLFPEEGEEIRSCKQAFVDRFGERECMILYGGEDGKNLFCTAKVDESMLTSASVYYPNVDPLYVPVYCHVTVGDRAHPVTALYRNHDRVLAFHALGVASLNVSSQDNAVESYPILRGVGNLAVGIDQHINGDPVIFGVGGLFTLSSPASDIDDFRIHRLAEIPQAMRDSISFANAILHSDPRHGEVWIRDPNAEDGVVWVYHAERKQWYAFDNLPATCFFVWQDSTGFAADHTLFLFDESLTEDNGTPICASLVSGQLFFSAPEAVKRGLRLSLCAETGNNRVQIELETDNGRRITLSPTSRSGSSELLLDRRVTGPGRFRFLRLRLRDEGTYRSRLHRLALFANI